MPALEKEILSPDSKSVKLLKWKVRKGTMVYKGSVLALYSFVTNDGDAQVCKLKADGDGTVVQLVAEEGEIIPSKGVILRVHTQRDQGCTHPTIMKDMCANCGADLRKENGISGDRKKSVSASVAMVHNIPELIVSQEQALELGKEDENRLLRQKKLVLLVDLDQTLIHTTNDQIPSNLKDVKHFQLWDGRGYMWYHTRFRPFTLKFLESVSKLYELHICTFGVRMYAHTIARLLDPEEKYFSHRILSRDECFDNLSKTANLKALFPCGDKMVGIIDDREDVWNFAPNLVHVKPYRFFQGTADINAPPGLTKSERDNIPIIHKTVTHEESRGSEDSCKEVSQSQSDTVETVDDSNVGKDGDGIKSGESLSLSEIENSTTESVGGRKPEDPVKNEDNSDQKLECETEDPDANREACDSSVKSSAEGLNLTSVKKSDATTDYQNNSEEMKEGNEGETETSDDGMKCNDEHRNSGMEVAGKSTETGEDEIEWDDSDDYLLHLEEILTRIHKAYYDMHEQLVKGGSGELPDLKNIIPYVKKKVLKGANVVFSGMFPVNMSAEKSKAFITAKSLGANVQPDIVPNKSKKSFSPDVTTHLLAAKAGTGKYKSALKSKGVHVVSGDWLWACADRWEWVDERLFIMAGKKDDGESLSEGKEVKKNKKNAKRKMKMSKGNENLLEEGDNNDDDCEDDVNESSPAKRSKTSANVVKKKAGKKGDGGNKFLSSYNPLLSFSNEDIEFMDKEVDEMMAEDENDSDESEEERDERIRKNVLGSSTDSDSDSDSLAGDFPRGWKMRRKSLSPPHKNIYDEDAQAYQEDDEETENELDRYQKTIEAFAPRDSDLESNVSGDSIGSVDEEMAAAVEKEFLGSL